MCAALVTSLFAMAWIGSATASLTGEFIRFHQFRMGDSRTIFGDLFLGRSCYVGSIAKTVRRAIALPGTRHLNENTAHTRSHGLRTLTFSPA